MDSVEHLRIAVLIPCLNEEQTVAKVIDDFRAELPAATIYVFDNASSDATAEMARRHGAEVIYEPRRGKGFVVERMFDSVEADLYIMVDGDDTYPVREVHRLIEPVVQHRADMAVGVRLGCADDACFRPMHLWGNRLVRRLINWIGGTNLRDILSGYRAFNRRVAERIPVVSKGFEIETELTMQMVYHRLEIAEVDVEYRPRPEGSASKLRTVQDGCRVLWKIFSLFRSFKPLTFFGGMGVLFFVLGLAAGYAPVRDYIVHPEHFVSHVPMAILATGLMLLSFGSVFLGIVLHALNWRFRELHSVLNRRFGGAA